MYDTETQTNTESEQPILRESSRPFIRKMAKLLSIFALLVVVLSAAMWFFLYTQQKNEHLIQGVPYWGSYVGSDINTSGGAATFSVLQYWGDTRFTPERISLHFPYRATADLRSVVTYGDYAVFFEENGYSADTQLIENIDELKEYIAKDIPVIVSQQIHQDAPKNTEVMRLLIGYSDETEVFISHDYNFGNNYEIPYNTFTSYAPTDGQFALIVIPSEEQLSTNQPSETRIATYEARHPVMDNPAVQKIHIQWVEIDTLKTAARIDYQKIAEIWEDILSSDGFSMLHPGARITASYDLARIYNAELHQHERAVEILSTVTIPVTHQYNLKDDYNGWQVNIENAYSDLGWYTDPLILLGKAYEEMASDSENPEMKAKYETEAQKAFASAQAILSPQTSSSE